MSVKRWWNRRRGPQAHARTGSVPVSSAGMQAVDIAAALAEQRVKAAIIARDLGLAVREYQTEINSYRNLLANADEISLSGAMSRHLTRYLGRAFVRMSVVQTLLTDHGAALASSAEAKNTLDPLLDIDAAAYGEQVALASYVYAEARLKAGAELPEALAAAMHAEAILRTAPLDSGQLAQLSQVLQLTFALANALGRHDAAAKAAGRLTALVRKPSTEPT